MGKEKKKTGVAFFERKSWYHRTKTLREDGTVKYGKIGGFATQEEAEESYWKYEEEFTKKAKRISGIPAGESGYSAEGLSDILV